VVWKTVRDRHPDRTLNGLNWQAVHDATKPLVEKADSMEEARAAMRGMLAKLGASHYAIIPKERYEDAKPALRPAAPRSDVNSDVKSEVVGDAPAPAPKQQEAPPEPDSKTITFGNLPETRLEFEAKKLPGGAGYIRFNEFLDPVSIMPKVESAVREFSGAPGIVLDLRGNRGGIGIMAMGIAGFFISEPGRKLGEMIMPDATLKFVVFPRPQAYKGKLAILVDGGSASTTEILAQGMQDLGRARIFGTLTAGAALPSDIVRLPNGDGFQFAEASYTSVNGKVLEGAGVTPDVEVLETAEARAAGRDLVVEAAEAWIAAGVQ
jgi:C-terminal processing protease CtpA/Prc